MFKKKKKIQLKTTLGKRGPPSFLILDKFIFIYRDHT